MKVGEAAYEKEGLKNFDSPMDGDWQQAGTEDKCATIYGTDIIWVTGDVTKLELNSKGTEAAFTNTVGGVVTLKLDTQDPARPILIFSGGDIWEKCEEQEEVQAGKKKKKGRTFKQKGDWTEADLLTALDVKRAHPGEIVSGQSLAKILEASLIQEKQLGAIIEAARNATPDEADNQEISLSDSIRLVCRIDANVRQALRMAHARKGGITFEEEKDIQDAENRMTQVELALGNINAQLDKILLNKMTQPTMPMKM